MRPNAQTRSFFLALSLILCAADACADKLDWGHSWDEKTYLGKCYPSLRAYVDHQRKMGDTWDYSAYKPLKKGEIVSENEAITEGESDFSEDVDAQRSRSLDDASGVYTVLIDTNPSKNPPNIVFRKENDGRQCIILLLPAGYLDLTLNQDGSLPEAVQSSASASGNFPSTEITFRLDKKKGVYEPYECRWSWWYEEEQTGRKEIISCDKAFDDSAPMWYPPDMRNPPFHRMLTEEEEIQYNGVNFRAPAFDCTKSSTKIEETICANAELSRLDTWVALSYERIKEASFNNHKRQSLIDDQRAWLKHRNACETLECLLDAYRHRIDNFCMKYPGYCPPLR